jgi:lysozyme
MPGDAVRGTLTAGTGHCGSDVVPGMVVTPEQDAAWLAKDIQAATIDAAVTLGSQYWNALDEVRRACLVDMALNLGRARLAGFVHMLDAIRRRDWDRAAREVRASKWAGEVGTRADDAERMLRDGAWPA